MSGADKGSASGQANKRSRARKPTPSESTRPGVSTTNAQAVEAQPADRSQRAPRVVLIVEDEAPIAEALSLIIADAGYSPMVARHGLEALEMARARRPALVITDLMMPRLDGAGLVAALRADAAANGTGAAPPIILMTAANIQLASQAGADAVLRKPFDIADVEALLRRFLPE